MPPPLSHSRNLKRLMADLRNLLVPMRVRVGDLTDLKSLTSLAIRVVPNEDRKEEQYPLLPPLLRHPEMEEISLSSNGGDEIAVEAYLESVNEKKTKSQRISRQRVDFRSEIRVDYGGIQRREMCLQLETRRELAG